ncbi:putative adipose-regulatory protein-domain-containing protein [Cytidiella melzeri]|nr:putative adipose-regulatory protein-domain-containing protein [Cytidiella melzeri]
MNTGRVEDKHRLGNESFVYSWIYFPVQVLSDLLHATWSSFRAYLPQLVPLVVFIVSIPVLLFFSVSAGWFVWRSIAVGWEACLYLQYGDGGSPYAQVQLPVLASQQKYDVSLHLVVPPSPANLELGNFMTTLRLHSPNNDTIVHIRRPALVLPSNSAPWSFLLGTRNTLTIDIPLTSNIVFGTSNAFASVEIGRKDLWRSLGRGEGRELTVSSAFLRGVVVHTGLRGLATRFPLLTALIASGSFFFISFVMLASCLLPMIEWRLQRHVQPSIESAAAAARRRRVGQRKAGEA